MYHHCQPRQPPPSGNVSWTHRGPRTQQRPHLSRGHHPHPPVPRAAAEAVLRRHAPLARALGLGPAPIRGENRGHVTRLHQSQLTWAPGRPTRRGRGTPRRWSPAARPWRTGARARGSPGPIRAQYSVPRPPLTNGSPPGPGRPSPASPRPPRCGAGGGPAAAEGAPPAGSLDTQVVQL